MFIEQQLIQRVLDISYKHKLSHLSSCIASVPIIYQIFLNKYADDKFILSCGHAGLAYYVVLEHFYPDKVNAEELLEKSGIHPERHANSLIDFSTGSLGMGLGASVGFALADRERKVYCVISDGEAAEGIVYEALNYIREQELTNLNVYVLDNGLSAYKKTDVSRLRSLLPSIKVIDTREYLEEYGLLSLEGHYKVMNQEDYQDAKTICRIAGI